MGVFEGIRYTHKMAISNNRIQEISDTTVTFSYKDYKDENKQKLMRVSCSEYVRRFALHILPKGYMKKQNFGILSSSWKAEKLPDLQQKLWDKQPLPPKFQGIQRPCPCCKVGNLRSILNFDHRGPPNMYSERWAKVKSQARS